MARSTYFDRGRIADACPGAESGYAQRFQCGNIVKRLIWTRMIPNKQRTEVTESTLDPQEQIRLRAYGLSSNVGRRGTN
jgi:hypothetical protein